MEKKLIDQKWDYLMSHGRIKKIKKHIYMNDVIIFTLTGNREPREINMMCFDEIHSFKTFKGFIDNILFPISNKKSCKN